ncbi:MAG: 30S ribosome-binding factor RbfA [Planctomycetaceae bacterium]|nr:30S ribosome-binding factor RbfA [Planctomycetaceae bacterium]
MTSRRTLKVAEALRETIATQILFGLKDPRVKNVTVLGVKVSGDLRNAKVYVSVMGDEKTQSLTMHGLNSARGFLQSKIADELNLRYTPILEFVLDDGVKKSIRASELLRGVIPESDQSAEESVASDEETTAAPEDSPVE